MITELINKQDSFEIVRDQIAAILTLESAEQMSLATAAGEDPADWKLRVYKERSAPWEAYLNAPTDVSPIVNVWFDASSFPGQTGNTVARQKAEGVFNIDCYGYGIAADDGGTGHLAGDEAAALEVQRAIKLVRNILMASEYTYLGLQGLVWQRWFTNISQFQPQQGTDAVQQIVGARLVFRVAFNELSPQYEATELCYLSTQIFRASDGQLLAEADFDYENEDYP